MKDDELFTISKDKLYLLVRTIKERSRTVSNPKFRLILKHKAEVLDQFLRWDYEEILDFYKKVYSNK